MYCPKCGQQNPDEAQFCGNCGENLPTTASPSSSNTPRSTPSASTGSGGAVSNEMKWGVAIASVFIPLIGIIMGAIYMADANVEKKSAGRQWLFVGIGAGVSWCVIVSLLSSGY